MPEGKESHRQALGRAGEELAAKWYENNGYEVIARNWRCREGEIDIVARAGRVFIFCEVKARTSDAFGTPAESVTREKQTRIRHLAARWIEDEAPVHPREIRFDVAAVLDGKLEILEGAF